MRLAPKLTTAVPHVARRTTRTAMRFGNIAMTKEIGVAELTAFEILCRDCHNAHHIGRIIALRDRAILDRVLAHLAKVNGISPKETMALVDAALKTHAKRSKKSWRMTVTPELLAIYPELVVVNTGLTVVYRAEALRR